MDTVLTHPVTLSVRKNLSVPGLALTSRILVGVSGGVDSMVLLYILHQLGQTVSAAHVNFNLRGEEAHNDALFVRKWCQDQGIAFHELSKDTRTYAAAMHLNTQTAARDIRYDWWEHLVHTHQFDFVATAHHLDDGIETFFLNLLRGTGLKGLKGIPHQRDFYIRPLIECRKGDVESFAQHFNIPYRTDSSNLSDNYQRNRIRHHLIPVLEDLNPGFHSGMRHTLHRVNVEWDTWEYHYTEWVRDNAQPYLDGFSFRVKMHEIPYLLRWLEEKGLPWNLVYDYVTSQTGDTGQVLMYDKYQLSRTEDGFYFEEIMPSVHLILTKAGSYSFGNFSISIEPYPGNIFTDDQNPWTEYADVEAFRWPLVIRNVLPGDNFQPLGMQGKTKKIQDFLVDLKLEMYEKERVLVLANEEHILWVIGLRLDERAKVTTGTEKIFRLSYTAAEVI